MKKLPYPNFCTIFLILIFKKFYILHFKKSLHFQKKNLHFLKNYFLHFLSKNPILQFSKKKSYFAFLKKKSLSLVHKAIEMARKIVDLVTPYPKLPKKLGTFACKKWRTLILIFGPYPN